MPTEGRQFTVFTAERWSAILTPTPAPSPMKTANRRVLLLSLVGVFFVQTYLVYFDPAGRQRPPLSPQAARGWRVWHDHNCQSCHQIHGFGGFLGPDLTNLATRLEGGPLREPERAGTLLARLDSVLGFGVGEMPAFPVDPEDLRALAVFLDEVDRTGVGQARVRGLRAPREILGELLDAFSIDTPADADELRGRRIADEAGCIDCHLPNTRSVHRATDLTRLSAEVDSELLEQILVEGIPERGMPRLGLAPDQVAALRAFLELLARHGDEIHLGFERAERASSRSLRGLPWFEFP